MYNRLVKNALSVAGQTVSLGIIWIILYPYILDTIGIEKLGVWSIVLATLSASRLSEMGFTASVTKFIATYRSENNEKAAVEALQTAAISLGLIVFIVLLLSYPLLQLIMPYFLQKNGLADGLEILPYALISIWFSVVSGIWMSGLDGCLRSDIRSGLIIISNLLLLFVAIILIDSHGLIGLAIAQISQGVALFVFGWIAIKKIMPSLPHLPIYWTYNQFRSMLIYGMNFQLNSILMILFEPTTKILLGRFSDLSIVGYFEMANRIVMMVRSLVIASNQTIVPIFAGINHTNQDKINDLYAKNMQYLLFLITPIFASLIAMMPVISEVLLGNYNSQFIIIGIILSFSWYFNSISAPSYFAYSGSGKLLWITVHSVLIAFTNLIFGIILGYFFGWQGVFMAYILALLFGSSFLALKYHQENKPKTNFSSEIFNFTICFSFSIIIISGHSYMLNANIEKLARIIITMIFVCAIFFFIIIMHPLSKEISSKILKLFGNSRGIV